MVKMTIDTKFGRTENKKQERSQPKIIDLEHGLCAILDSKGRKIGYFYDGPRLKDIPKGSDIPSRKYSRDYNKRNKENIKYSAQDPVDKISDESWIYLNKSRICVNLVLDGGKNGR